MRQAHGGYVVQARRRNEQYLACNACGQRHSRANTYPIPETDERITPMRLAGLVAFVIFMFGSIIYGGAIVGTAIVEAMH